MNANALISAMYDGQVLIFAHSGAQAYAPSNTLPAFELAAKQGAHGTELDVHRSRDGHVIVIHDSSVDATTDGRGTVAEMTLAQLKALDAGSSYSPEFAGTPIPTLDEVFETVGKQLFVNVEIKSDSAETDGLEQAVVDCILRHAMQERVLISSFNPLALRRFRALLPGVPIGFLYGHGSPGIVRELIKEVPYEAYHPEDDLIDEALMETARRQGHLVNAWTINDTRRALELVKLGVSGIITDAPDQMLAALEQVI
jgi:glycerophosphoryl diester phosphodiesterase